MIKLFRNKKKKAIAFVDYEYWFYSCKERFNLYPNLQRWKDEIAKRFELKDIMVFGDFSHENIAGDLHKVRSITNTVIETSNTFMRKKKDMTDFIMLDYIYQTIEQQKGIDTYILFTGDGHFQTVVKCLKEKKKSVIVCGIEDSFSKQLQSVIVCGIEDSFSKQLRDTASEVIMVDIEKELFERNCKMVLNSMAMIEDQKDLLANFLQAVENVSKASNIPEEEFGKMLVRALKLGCGETERR